MHDVSSCRIDFRRRRRGPSPSSSPRSPWAVCFAGWFLVALGSVFALLWLAEDIPAVLRNEPSRTLVDTGLLTNPVHVIDYAFVLPTHIIAGIWLLQRRRAGQLLAPIVLAFGVLMASSIGGMMVVMHVIGAPAAAPVTFAMFAVAASSAFVLARLLRPPGDTPSSIALGSRQK